jgi:DNA-binding NtrC family response regulator
MTDPALTAATLQTAALPPVRLLIAEDEEHLGAILEHFLRGRGYLVTMCRDGKSALQAMQSATYDVALIDIVMPEMDGLEVLRHLQTEPEPPEVIIITGNGTIDTAITAIKLGAYDYISKPYRMAEIDVMVRRAWEKRELMRVNTFLRDRTRGQLPGDMRSVNATMSALIAELTEIAPTSDCVTLRGPAGSGKSRLARFIHSRSGRLPDALVEVSSRADAVSAGNMLALLFGHEPNAVRGMTGRHNGVLQRAEHGTVVIDARVLEKSERMALSDAIARGSFSRVGSTQQIPLTARVILCDRGEVGETLPGRHFTVPSLHERVEDIPLLVAELAAQSDDGIMRTVVPDALPLLLQYSWPGNVRELKAVVSRAAMLAPKGEITVADMRMVLVWGGSNDGSGAPLADLERLHIEAMLVRTNWHQGRTAKALGISTKTLYRKMREYGFVRPRRRRLSRTQEPGSGSPA